MKKQFNIYEPDYRELPKEPSVFYTYYEVRIWKNNVLREAEQFKLLKQARNFYKKQKLDIYEECGSCYVEITKIKPLKKYK